MVIPALKIAVVTTSFPADADDASGHFVRSDALARARPGDRITVVTPGVPGTIEGEGLDVVRVGCARAYGWPGAAARVRANPGLVVEGASFVPRARAALVELHPDVCVAHWALPSALAVPRGVPLEIVSHGADVRLLAELPYPLVQLWVRHLTARATSWQFVSQALRGLLEARLSADSRRALAAKAFVRAPRLDMPLPSGDDVTRRRAHMAARTVYSVVGRLVREKRVDHALAHVGCEEGAAIAVVGDGPDRARLEARAHALGVRAHFVGAVGRREALAWMAASDALLFASRVEGLSTVLREADALGVRVVRL